MRAVIMAGGEGTRLRPLTCGRPKPMVPVANKPVMEHILDLLKKHGISNVAATLQYMPDMIREYFEDGSKFGIGLKYYVEHKPLGTAGSVKNAEEFLDGTFLVISGDALTDIDLISAVSFHEERNATATLVLKRVDVPLEYGVVVTDGDGRIIRFLEKPGWGEVFSDTVNTGIYILSPEIFEYIKPGAVYDFSKDLFPMLMKDNKRLYGYITEDYWCDIGDAAAYIQAHNDVMNGIVNVNIPGEEKETGIRVGTGTEIDGGVLLRAPCIIGSGCRIRGNAEIGSFSVIGDNSIVSDRCGIKRTIIWKNCFLGENVQLRGSIICGNAHIKNSATAFEQSIVGEHSLVDEHAIIRPSVKIWPDKYIGKSVEIHDNIVWGSKAGRQIFANRGVGGHVNTDITPEFAARIGAAYGAVKGNKGNIGVSFDGSPGALMIKHAVISGLLSSGISVVDYGRLTMPALRSAVRFCRLDGGIHVSECTGAESKVMIEMLDGTGSSIGRSAERKIESSFTRNDFSRCESGCIKNVTEMREFMDFYIMSILRDVKSKGMKYKIALNACCPEYVTEIIMDLLEKLDLSVVAVNEDNKGNTGTKNMEWFCNKVKNGKFDIGVSIGDTCEKMILVDDKGRLVTEDMFIALIALILFRKIQGGTVIVPLSASLAVEKLADEYQGKVVRTKTSVRDMMMNMLGKEAKEELLEQFTMNFDAAACLVKLLDYMSLNSLRLSDLVNMIPEIHMRRREVECGWGSKGKVIRKLMQEHAGGRMEMLEGVKLYDDRGWVLILPDAEKPVCSVIGEGINAEFAEELTDIYVRKVREISRS